MSKKASDFYLAFFLTVIIAGLSMLNFQKSAPFQGDTGNILLDRSTNTIYLDSLTLRQKIAQMIVVYEKGENRGFLQRAPVGGIHLGAKPTKESFRSIINEFQTGTIIPFFVTVDMEGCGNPFESFQEFPTFREIRSKEEAYQVGYEQGRLLKELGFSINFAPVVDLQDTIWNCRSFIGTPEEISEYASSYIAGLEENRIIATSKHYPGRTLVAGDTHKYVAYASIDESDLVPFEGTIKNNVSAIMISHVIVDGSVTSGSSPSSVSEQIVGGLRDRFPGLIITDEVNMMGLKSFYSGDIDRMYIDVFKAGNDLVLNFNTDPRALDRMISVIEQAVERGEISEKRIDGSVTRILRAKGMNVVG